MIELIAPFTYDYMLKAMWVSALVGGVCAFLSAYLTLKGWSLIGDALAHSVVPGVAAAYLLKLPYAAGAFVAGLLAALAFSAHGPGHTRVARQGQVCLGEGVVQCGVPGCLHQVGHVAKGHDA